MDLLTPAEEVLDEESGGRLRFDIEFLARRLETVSSWLAGSPRDRRSAARLLRCQHRRGRGAGRGGMDRRGRRDRLPWRPAGPGRRCAGRGACAHASHRRRRRRRRDPAQPQSVGQAALREEAGDRAYLRRLDWLASVQEARHYFGLRPDPSVDTKPGHDVRPAARSAGRPALPPPIPAAAADPRLPGGVGPGRGAAMAAGRRRRRPSPRHAARAHDAVGAAVVFSASTWWSSSSARSRSVTGQARLEIPDHGRPQPRHPAPDRLHREDDTLRTVAAGSASITGAYLASWEATIVRSLAERLRPLLRGPAGSRARSCPAYRETVSRWTPSSRAIQRWLQPSWRSALPWCCDAICK